MAGKRFKFPDSKSRPANSPAVLCPADRVLHLYNQDHETPAKKISKKVREWFFAEAHSKGWNEIGRAHV